MNDTTSSVMLSIGTKTTSRVNRSRFDSWDARSAVRAKSLPSAADFENTGTLFFSPDCVSTANHPLMVARGDDAVHRLLTYSLFEHLNFTDALENEIVTPVAYLIGRRLLNFSLPTTMLADARRLAVDEMHHALMATEYVQEISNQSGVAPPPTRRPLFLRRMDEIKSQHDRDIAPLLMLFFATISETLITNTLYQVPNDPRVNPGVRRILRDHAEDETRHRAYFSDVLAHCWPRLKPSPRAIVGPLLPRFIRFFLEPDLLQIQERLGQLGFSNGEIGRLMEECYSPNQINAAIRSNSSATLRLMARTGILEDAATVDAFCNVGLI